MKLLRADGNDLVLETFDDESQRYAILSHRWLADEDEVLYDDIVTHGIDVGQKPGLKKLNWCRQQAVADGFQYVWIDTVCIDKSSSQELTESINSMYRWYEKAEVCYVYLHDMPDRHSDADTHELDSANGPPTATQALNREPNPAAMQNSVVQIGSADDETSRQASEVEKGPLTVEEPVESADPETLSNKDSSLIIAQLKLKSIALQGWDRGAFANCQWFTRAWTLQELIAPRVLRFYSSAWTLISELSEIAPEVAMITGIHEEVLTKRRHVSACSIAQKMSWAARRQSKKIEDRTYSLIGLMDVAMSVIYGEGPRAFQRLQEEILRSSSDDSIFAFKRHRGKIAMDAKTSTDGVEASALLAECPEDFGGCGGISLNTWFDSKNAYQIVTKQIDFRTRVLEDKPRTVWRNIVGWLRKRSPTPSRSVIKQQVVLDCSLEHSPSTVFVLNLFAFSGQPGIFYVAGDEPRVTELSAYDQRAKKCSSKSFSVVRKPDELSASAAVTMPISCQSKNNNMTLQLVETSLPGSWHAKDATFIVPSGDEIFKAELDIWADTSPIGTVRISSEYWRATQRCDLQVKFPGASLDLRLCKLLLLHGWYPCTVTRAPGGFLIAKAFKNQTVLGDFRSQVLELEHVSLAHLVRYCIFHTAVLLARIAMIWVVCMSVGSIAGIIVLKQSFIHPTWWVVWMCAGNALFVPALLIDIARGW